MPDPTPAAKTLPTVLIVEDEKPLAALYRRWLEENYEVVVRHTGAGALEVLDGEEATAIDVVLLDRRLPEQSGKRVLFEATRGGGDCRVAMVTGVKPGFDVAMFPVDEYLLKPVERTELRRVVWELQARSTVDVSERELLAMISRRSALETQHSPEELETNDAYQRLVERIELGIEHLDGAPEETSSPYRPDACPGCDLRWDVDVDGVVGFVRLASRVWKCTDCGETVRQRDDGGQVFKR